MCGESVSSIIKKIVIQEITFMKNDPRGSSAYDYHMLVPMSVSIEKEEQIIEANYNKIRQILELKKIKLS